jgi:hypothetical protein
MAPLLECHEASKHHLLKFGYFLLDSINLGFILRERLATVLIIPSSWGSQLGGYPTRIIVKHFLFSLAWLLMPTLILDGLEKSFPINFWKMLLFKLKG